MIAPNQLCGPLTRPLPEGGDSHASKVSVPVAVKSDPPKPPTCPNQDALGEPAEGEDDAVCGSPAGAVPPVVDTYRGRAFVLTDAHREALQRVAERSLVLDRVRSGHAPMPQALWELRDAGLIVLTNDPITIALTDAGRALEQR